MITNRIYVKPASIAEALRIAEDHAGDFGFVAGGTDAMVNKYQGNLDYSCLIDITGLHSLKQVSLTGEHLGIGALVRLDDLGKFPLIKEHFPTLIKAAGEVASPMLRKSATLGGNVLCENRCSYYNQSEFWREAVGYCLKCEGDICIATGGRKACFSKFVSDTAPVLIAAHATIEVHDANGLIVRPLESIYTGDGIKPRNLDPTTLLTRILLPMGRNFKIVFRKLRPREAVDFTSLTTAVSIDNTGNIRMVVGGVDPKPVVIEGKKGDDIDVLVKKALSKCRVVDNDYYSRGYRREMMQLFLRESLEELG